MQKLLPVLLTALSGFFSCNSAVPQFNAEHAFNYLVKQCEFGPRVPGTPAHSACRDFLIDELKQAGATVSRQDFNGTIALTGETVRMSNIIASFGLQNKQRVLLCAHWDSRPWADQDPIAENRKKPVPGANDGASGVAVLLEVARHLNKQAPLYGVDIILFDGEDSGSPGMHDTYTLGSQFFARNKDSRYHPRFGILLDMVGDSDLRIPREGNSVSYAPAVVDMVWQRATDLGLNVFDDRTEYWVTDDHLPLINAGMPVIDLIDFNYQHWHTVNDTPDKCSPESLAQTGRLLLSILYEQVY